MAAADFCGELQKGVGAVLTRVFARCCCAVMDARFVGWLARPLFAVALTLAPLAIADEGPPAACSTTQQGAAAGWYVARVAEFGADAWISRFDNAGTLL